MRRNIDDLVDKRTRELKTPGEKFEERFLDSRPTSQWPAYLDETAKDIVADISIGGLDLTRDNFPHEIGSYYRDGMISSAGTYTDLPDVLDQTARADEIGSLVYQLNRLSYELERSETGLENVQHAVEAVIEKIFTRETEERLDSAIGRDSETIAELLLQLFSDAAIAGKVDVIIDEFENSISEGLLTKLDEPQMMTSLWLHQHDALEEWRRHDYRGYVDMATATGKTVLGLAAIALRYGALHPLDEDIDTTNRASSDGRKSRVLVVAHNDLIIEQWRREFDRHLNIPPERTHQGSDVKLSWGTIHFRTPQTLLNQEWIDYDLVILDEAHHYANGSGWGELLSQFDSEILALSGSVDDGGTADQQLRERLQKTVGPEIKRYTITDAQRDGVIPTFEWEVTYTPFEGDVTELAEISKESESAYYQFRERLESNALSLDTDRRLRTYQDIQTFTHTSAGKELKRTDDQFRNLATALFSRRTKLWNQSPRLDVIVDLAIDHAHEEKVVILTDNNSQIDEINDRLVDHLDDAEQVYTVFGTDDSKQQRDTIDAFDAPGEPAVLIGTGDLLGEGVDMQHASIAINMATGGVNPQLIQRIGRVLRNPEGDKHPCFYNVVGIPHSEEVMVPREDGLQFLENAAQFFAFGTRFDRIPAFRAVNDVGDTVVDFFQAGYEYLDELDSDDGYDWPDDEAEREALETLLARLDEELDADPAASRIFTSWRKSFNSETRDTETDEHVTSGSSTRETEVSTTNDDGTEVSPETEEYKADDGTEIRDAVEDKEQPSRLGTDRAEMVPTVVINEDGGQQSDSRGMLQLNIQTQSGHSVVGAFVSVSGNECSGCGTTDEDGVVTFELANDTYTVAVHHPDYPVYTTELLFDWSSRATRGKLLTLSQGRQEKTENSGTLQRKDNDS